MGGFISLKINPIHVAIIVLFINIFASSTDAEGVARLSYSVAQTVCKSTTAFSRSNKIEPPSKAATANDKLCKTLTWNNCETRGGSTSACQKFKVKECTAQSQSQSQPQPQRSKESKMSRILHGVEAKPYEFPHIVRITKNNNTFCDGTIWNENYIITAAHCVYSPSGKQVFKNLTVIAGEHNTKVEEGTEQRRKVTSAIMHETFDPKTGKTGDIAVLLLDAPLVLSEKVLPADMPQQDYNSEGDGVTVAGWGVYDPNGDGLDGRPAEILQKADLIVIPAEKCKSFYDSYPLNALCVDVGSVGELQSPCLGDSGGPLTKKLDNGHHLFLGVVSYGRACNASVPSVFTQVSAYIGWITGIVDDC